MRQWGMVRADSDFRHSEGCLDWLPQVDATAGEARHRFDTLMANLPPTVAVARGEHIIAEPVCLERPQQRRPV